MERKTDTPQPGSIWDHVDDFLRWLPTRDAPDDPPPVKKRAVECYRSKLRHLRAYAGDQPVDLVLLTNYRAHMQFEAPGKHGGPGQKPRTI
ncbi:MAG TPA: hypothetical protein VFU47_07245, partial [Armatimonadota bacterium]|nr:hypothetical protein [Armatimonadota bacterium]